MSQCDAWMPQSVGDYLADTMHLRAAEHGAYLLLLMQYWRAGPLPDDDRKLAAIARMDEAEWRICGPVVRAFFQASDGGVLRQARCDAAREASQARVSKRRNAAKTASKARWNSETMPIASESHAISMRGASESHANRMRGASESHANRMLDASESHAPRIPIASEAHGSAAAPAGKVRAGNLSDEMTTDKDTGLLVCNNYFVDMVFEKATEAARIDPGKLSLTWDAMLGWLRDGIEPEQIYAAIRRCAARPGYQPPRSLAYFDRAVREHRMN